MSGYEDMNELFEGAGLGVPPVPEHLRTDVKELRPWTFATFDIAADDLYDFDSALRGAFDRRAADSFAVGHVGHGVNSYAIGYQVVTRWFIVVLQLAWGGVYMDAEKTTDGVRRSFNVVGSLLALHPPANVAGGHLAMVSADFRQLSAIGWLEGNELVDVRAWAEEHATADAIEAAQIWASEESWTSRPTGDDRHDRFIWKPGDVTILRKGNHVEEEAWGGSEPPSTRAAPTSRKWLVCARCRRAWLLAPPNLEFGWEARAPKDGRCKYCPGNPMLRPASSSQGYRVCPESIARWVWVGEPPRGWNPVD